MMHAAGHPPMSSEIEPAFSNNATACLPGPRSQHGMALISALLLLVVVTILAVSMFRSFGMQEKIAGNTREKQRAVNAAVSAQQYAEWFLSSGTPPTAGACTGVVPASPGQICNNPPADFTILPWSTSGTPVGVTYTPFTTQDGNGVVSNVTGNAPVAGSYYTTPLFYISTRGPLTLNGSFGEVYQVDAVGYGGTANSVAVVESTYFVSLPYPWDPGT
jgi:type IV pilus assembly protein PilX